MKAIKSGRMRRVGHAARMGEMRNSYKILIGKPEGERPLRRPRRVSDWMLRKQDVKLWTGFMWLRIRSSGELL